MAWKECDCNIKKKGKQTQKKKGDASLFINLIRPDKEDFARAKKL
jgi:hypothetical protein